LTLDKQISFLSKSVFRVVPAKVQQSPLLASSEYNEVKIYGNKCIVRLKGCIERGKEKNLHAMTAKGFGIYDYAVQHRFWVW
jgi:hypothetical protein